MTSMSEQAWEEQDECLKSGRGGKRLHIVGGGGGAVCGQTPKADAVKDPGQYRGWGVEWCRTCLRVRYRNPTDESECDVDSGEVVVVSRIASNGVYHTDESCSRLPEDGEEVVVGELPVGWDECWFCRQEDRGVPE